MWDNMDTKSLQIKFESESHQIDANTLINILIHYNTVIMAANKEFGDGTKTINIQVNALKEGSFIIDLSVVSNLISALFSSGSLGYVSNLITITQGVFAAYKILKGNPARTEVEKNLINAYGDNAVINQTIVNVYNYPLTREAISKSIETASADENVGGISILSKDNPTVYIDKKEFSDLVYTDFDKEDEIPQDRVIEEEDVILVIKSLSFQKGSTWSFFYRGLSISFAVKDDALMDAINRGIQFGKGDAIRVKLKIIQRYSSEYNTYVNKSYKIIEFYELIKAKYDTNVELL